MLILVDVGALLLELGVTGLTDLDNTRESRRVSVVRGDKAGDGIGVGIPYGCGWRP